MPVIYRSVNLDSHLRQCVDSERARESNRRSTNKAQTRTKIHCLGVPAAFDRSSVRCIILMAIGTTIEKTSYCRSTVLAEVGKVKF